MDAFDLVFKANAAHDDVGVLVERHAIAAVDATKNAALVALAKVRRRRPFVGEWAVWWSCTP